MHVNASAPLATKARTSVLPQLRIPLPHKASTPVSISALNPWSVLRLRDRSLIKQPDRVNL